MTGKTLILPATPMLMTLPLSAEEQGVYLAGTKTMPDPARIYDVIILGAGGAGCAAAIEASRCTSDLLLVTAATMTDTKTQQAQGGIQAAFGENDSPDKHYEDTLRTGQHANDPKLVRILADSARETIHWLESLGVPFNKKDGAYVLQSAAGLSKARVLSVGDLAGRSIVAALGREIERLRITVAKGAAATRISRDAGLFSITLRLQAEGRETTLQTRSVVIATGGFMPREKAVGYADTSKAETPDGLELAGSLGAEIVCPDLVQFHPTGVLLPKELRRERLPETMRSAGAVLRNRHGGQFADSLLTRNDLTQAIVAECEKGGGIATDDGRLGVWLDTPRIETVSGTGAIKERFPSFHQMFLEHGHDLAKKPVLVYPVLHYSLGGIKIDEHCESTVPGCFAAGEVSWGVHGKERLMGNSLLDIFVFGRIAGRSAAAHALKLHHA
jgi:succinate dehydrogenase / fumarate reductase flavoprotein subunit